MKSCPTCNRTYPDDNLAFCLMDGAVLSAPDDPAKAERNPAARGSNAKRTEVMNPPPNRVGPAAPLPSPLRTPAQKVTPPYADKLPRDGHASQQAATGLIRATFALRGAVGILIGLLTLFLMSTAFRMVILAFVAYVFVGGVCALAAALRAWIARKPAGSYCWMESWVVLAGHWRCF
jgi:hypothetical protein